MAVRSPFFFAACLAAGSFVVALAAQQAPLTPPSPAAARILLLPRRIVSGERAMLAVLDVNGRLTPGVTINFSNGDHLKTDSTGRALFVAPLNPGLIYGSIEGRPGRVSTVILTPAEASAAAMQISSAPRVASLADRFEILGKGFCGDADANHVTIADHGALVLASSPAALTVLPPMELEPGPVKVSVACAKRDAPEFSVTFVDLELRADSSPLKRGEHRTLTVSGRCSPRFSGEESALSSRSTNVTENSGASRFAQATLTFTGPGSSSIGGRTVSAAGEEASTSAPWSAMVTWLASASPQNPFPRISKRSANEATRGAEEICIAAADASAGVRITVDTRPGRPSIEP